MTDLGELSENKGHTIVSWNVRSLHPRLDEVERLLDIGEPEILGLSETCLSDNTTDAMISIDGYNIVHGDRTTDSGKRGGGGVLFYYRNNLRCASLPEYTLCDPHIETIWLHLKLTNTRKIYYGLIYRPPSGNVTSFLETLENICLELRSLSNCEINLIGDFNLDLLKRRDPKVKQYLDSMRRMGFTQLIPTSQHIRVMMVCIFLFWTIL